MNYLFAWVVGVIRVVNAMVQTNTLATRAATPLLNEITYYASDTQQGWVAVDGDWKEIASRRGIATLGATDASVAVSFAVVGSTASLVPILTTSYSAGHLWVTSLTATGFTANVETTDAGAQTIYWTVKEEW